MRSTSGMAVAVCVCAALIAGCRSAGYWNAVKTKKSAWKTFTFQSPHIRLTTEKLAVFQVEKEKHWAEGHGEILLEKGVKISVTMHFSQDENGKGECGAKINLWVVGSEGLNQVTSLVAYRCDEGSRRNPWFIVSVQSEPGTWISLEVLEIL